MKNYLKDKNFNSEELVVVSPDLGGAKRADKLADELNQIEYCMCLSKGIIKDTEYKLKHNKAYFKKI